MCNICDMLKNPNHEQKLKVLAFHREMEIYRQKVEAAPEDQTIAEVAEIQEQELEKIFNNIFEDTEDNRLYFHQLVSSALFAFAIGAEFDLVAMEKDISDDRINHLN